jgi:transposase-like protein
LQHARIAQSVEQRIENPRVGGSIPPPGTIRFNELARLIAGFFVSKAPHGGLAGEQATKSHSTRAPNRTPKPAPHNLSVAQLAREEGTSDVTFYAWLKQAKAAGAAMPGDQKLTDNWSAEARLAVVIETAALSEIELSEYCRRKGLYPQQVKTWKSAFLTCQQSAKVQSQADRAQTKAGRNRAQCKPKRTHLLA